MPIYTKTGDKGSTGLFSTNKNKKKRTSKASLRIEAIGSIDEANTSLGLAASLIKNKTLKEKIFDIQKNLFVVGAILAGAKLSLDKKASENMEKEIDAMDKVLPKLTYFILPGGGLGGSHLFMSRTFVRRAERNIVALSKKEKVPPDTLIYINRLSDYIYTLARYVNFKDKIKEEAWRR